MKNVWALTCAVALGLAVGAAASLAAEEATADADKPVVAKYEQGSGPWHGYKISNPVYETIISCTPQYGFFAFQISFSGEKVTYARGSEMALAIADDETKQRVFCSSELHTNKEDIVISEKPGAITWALSPACAREKGMVAYSGSVTYEPRKVTLTHNWTLGKDIKGTTLAGNLSLGIPLLTGCPFEAVLADGSTVKGEIPDELPETPARYTPDALGKGISSILFDTKKGKVKMTFIRDKQVDMAKEYMPVLQTMLHKYDDPKTPPFRRYELPLYVSDGKKDVPRTYSIVFEFPE